MSTYDAFTGVHIDVYKPAAGKHAGHQSTKAFSIPEKDVQKAYWKQQAGKPTDQGKVTLSNDHEEYSHPDEKPLDVDDKLVIYVTVPDGSGGFTDEKIATLLVDEYDFEFTSQNAGTVELTVIDYVFGILDMGRVYFKDVGVPISGSSDALVNGLLDDRFPWIDQSKIETFSTSADYMADGITGTKAIDELSSIAAYYGNDVIVYGEGESLVMKSLGDTSPVNDFGNPFGPKDFKGELSISSEKEEMTNYVRIAGGIDDDNVDDSQEDTSGGTVQVTQSNRLITRVENRKSQLVKFELYTVGDGTSEDGIRIRLQASNEAGDGPVAPDDTDSDLISTGAEKGRKVALDDDGWTTFRVGTHDIPRQPWMIIDSPGDNGYGVKVASDGVTPAYRVHFPKPILAEVPSATSLENYLTHDGYIRNEAIVTQAAARQRAVSELGSYAWPTLGVGPLVANSERAYNLQLGDTVTFDQPGKRIQGEFVVTRRRMEYSGTSISSELEFFGVDNRPFA